MNSYKLWSIAFICVVEPNWYTKSGVLPYFRIMLSSAVTIFLDSKFSPNSLQTLVPERFVTAEQIKQTYSSMVSEYLQEL